jgi:hypothetical protein
MPEAPALTTATASSTAQGTPNAASEPVKTAPAAAPAAPAAAPATSPETKAEAAKEPQKPAATPAQDAKDGKPAADAKTKEAAKPSDPAAKPGEAKPVEYDIKLPQDAKIGQAEVDVIKGFAKANEMTNEQAQAVAWFVDYQHAQTKELVDGKWLEESKNHPVYGKEKFPETCETIKRTLEKWPKVQALLDKTGFVHNPDVFEMLAEISAKGKDDSLVQGGAAVVQDNRPVMQRMADNWNKAWGAKK